jgi:hypothetical protein
MKQTLIFMALLASTSTAFAAEAPQQGKGQNFDKIKTDVIGRINARIARNQEELSCVQGAKNHADLKACRDKFREEVKEQRERMREQRK